MGTCLKDFDCISNWVFSNLAWELLLVALIVILPTTIKIFKISKFLLKQNRFTRGNGWGTHLTDRFIDSWRNPKGLRTGQMFYTNPNQIPSRWWLKVIDEKLQEKGLVNIKDNSVYPIRNLRNKIITKILKFSLINITGDNKSEYSDI